MRRKEIARRALSLGLSAAMVLGMTLSAFAEGPDDTQITDKPNVSHKFDNIVKEVYLSKEDTEEFREKYIDIYYGEEEGAGDSVTWGGEYQGVYVIDENTTFSLDWDNMVKGKEDIRSISVELMPWYRDESGKLECTRWMGREDLEIGKIGRYLMTTSTIAFTSDEPLEETNLYNQLTDATYNLHEVSDWGERNGYYSYSALSNLQWNLGSNLFTKDQVRSVPFIEDDHPAAREINNRLCFVDSTGNLKQQNYSYTWYDFDNERWVEDVYTCEEWLQRAERLKDNMDIVYIAAVKTYYDNGKRCNWSYIIPKESYENKDCPFTFLDEDPSKEEETEDTDEVFDVTVTDKPISAEEFAALLEENQTKDVVITSNDGVTITFEKGTMKEVEGKTEYDFSLTISTDYEKHADYANVSKENFVAVVDFNYSGNLPAEAKIKIPVGAQYAGKTLYYTQYMPDKSYSLMQSAKVDADGYITVKQSHCSTYFITTNNIASVEEENTTKPEETTTKPEETTTEKETTAKGEETTQNTGKAEETNAPDTGDTFPYGLLVAAVLACAVCVTVRKKCVE